MLVVDVLNKTQHTLLKYMRCVLCHQITQIEIKHLVHNKRMPEKIFDFQFEHSSHALMPAFDVNIHCRTLYTQVIKRLLFLTQTLSDIAMLPESLPPYFLSIFMSSYRMSHENFPIPSKPDSILIHFRALSPRGWNFIRTDRKIKCAKGYNPIPPEYAD